VAARRAFTAAWKFALQVTSSHVSRLGTLEVLERSRSWNARGLGTLGVLARSGCFVGAQIDRLLSDQIKGISAVTKLPTLPRADPLAECDDDVSFAAENSETLLLASSGVILNHGGAGSGIPQQ
jgi:hypothetical protein